MKPLNDFLIQPLGERYNNKLDVDGKELLLNSNIENYKFVNKLALVIEHPLNFCTDIEVGDIIVIHHNVFRRYYNMKGEERNSRSYFKNGQYLVSPEQIFLYYKNDRWNSFLDRCFVIPIREKNHIENKKTKSNYGILKYGNKKLEELNIYEGQTISFKNRREFEFAVNNDLLYCMRSNDILLNHGYKENQEEYNPSWAKGS